MYPMQGGTHNAESIAIYPVPSILCNLVTVIVHVLTFCAVLYGT